MQLRSNLTIERDVDRFGDPILVIRDLVVHRFFSLPAEAEPILERLRSPVDLDVLVTDFADVFAEDELSNMVRGLEANHLLETGLDADALRRHLRAAHREERWAAMQRAVRRARTDIPIYRDKFRTTSDADIESPAALERAPYLTKSEIRAHYPDGFLPEGIDLQAMLGTGELRLSMSSGTAAGDRLQMIFSREARGLQMAAGVALNDELNAASKQPNAVLTSMHCADPDACVLHHPDMAARVADSNRLMLVPPHDPGAPTQDEIRRTFDELRSFGVRWLDCNPTYLTILTYAAVDAGLELPRLDVISCGYEFLTEIHRRFLKQAWSCDVYCRYTASEVGNYQIIECHHHSMHVNDRYYYAELVRDGRFVQPGGIGRLVQTTVQETVPIVRYDTGDLFFASDDVECACGSASRVIGPVAGRTADLISATDGTPRTTLEVDTALSVVAGLRHYQLVQTAPDAYRVKVVADPSADAAAVRDDVVSALRVCVGSGAQVRTEAARHAYPEPSGKFRITRSELPGADGLISLT